MKETWEGQGLAKRICDLAWGLFEGLVTLANLDTSVNISNCNSVKNVGPTCISQHNLQQSHIYNHIYGDFSVIGA